MTLRLARWLAALAAAVVAMPVSAQLSTDARKTYDDFQRLAPHRAFASTANGEGYGWAGDKPSRKFGACIPAFIEPGARQAPGS